MNYFSVEQGHVMEPSGLAPVAAVSSMNRHHELPTTTATIYPGMRQYGARMTLITLSIINLMNYADRYVPSSVKSLIQDELQSSDFQTSLPTTGSFVFTIR